MDQDIFQFY